MSVAMTLMLMLSMLSFTAQAQFSSFLKPPSSAEEKAEPAQTPGPASYATLADLLEDDAARATLIEQLRALAATPGVATPGAATPGAATPGVATPADPAAKPSPAATRAGTTPAAQDADAATTQSEVVPAFSDRVADEAQQFVEDLMAGASTAVATFRALAAGDSSRFTRLSGWP